MSGGFFARLGAKKRTPALRFSVVRFVVGQPARDVRGRVIRALERLVTRAQVEVVGIFSGLPKRRSAHAADVGEGGCLRRVFPADVPIAVGSSVAGSIDHPPSSEHPLAPIVVDPIMFSVDRLAGGPRRGLVGRVQSVSKGNWKGKEACGIANTPVGEGEQEGNVSVFSGTVAPPTCGFVDDLTLAGGG